MNLLNINEMTKIHTERKIFDCADFSLEEGDKVGIVGVNGTGKTTLLRILAEEESIDSGVYTKGNHVVINYLPQETKFEKGIKIYDYVTKECSKSTELWDMEGEIKSILQILGVEDIHKEVDNLSGGEKKRVALAAALAQSCDVLILDEPTNHLDCDMANWLEQYLKKKRVSLIMVTHDRYFLEEVCNKIVEIDQGKIYSYEGNYEKFLSLKSAREEMEIASERKRQSLYRVELEWVKRGARARSTKQKSRIDRFEELKANKRIESNDKLEMSSIGSRLGKKTIELYDLSKKYDDRVLFDELEYIFLRDDRIGIVGRNGCGKSTLLNLITGVEQPDVGRIEIGETVKIGYFSQMNERMNEKEKVIDYIKESGEYIETADGKITAAKMLERFLFDKTMQYQLIEKLSGGERRRLYLLRVLMTNPNVLILDEPTNDLDITTLNILESYLDEFQGIVIVVSHDRYFLDRVINRVLAFEYGKIMQYEGSYTDYQLKREDGLDIKEKKYDTKQKNTDYKQRDRKKKLKFSYNEQKEFETIDTDIEALETKLESIESDIENSATDFLKLKELMEKKQKVQQKLEQKMERWVYLQELEERIKEEQESSK